jgi:4-aminobutyrate aminotransferase/(S)-3-amino-2-methylpropionate transaminase
VPRGISTAHPIFVKRAENARLWDEEGRSYIDFAGGIAVLNTGHRHPRIIKAISEQLDHFTHSAFQVAGYEPYIALTERLNALAPFKGPAKTILFSTGAEAVENAVKIARACTGRSGIIAFTGAFHGRTLLASAMTGKMTYKRGFGPFPAETFHIPFPTDAESGPGAISVQQSLMALDLLFTTDIDPERVAAIIIEPVQGEGGFNVAPPELLRQLRLICDQHGILLIADEIQSGFARTGKWFAIEHAAVEPDLVVVAKSIAGGLPLSGVIGRSAIMDAPEPGCMGGTYGGNPLACAAALAVIDVINTEQLLQRAETIGAFIRARLSAMQMRNDLVPTGPARGLGAMIAFDILRERSGGPDPDAAKRVTQQALQRGLIVLSCGAHGNVIRLLMPLTIEHDALSAGMDALERALSTEPC